MLMIASWYLGFGSKPRHFNHITYHLREIIILYHFNHITYHDVTYPNQDILVTSHVSFTNKRYDEAWGIGNSQRVSKLMSLISNRIAAGIPTNPDSNKFLKVLMTYHRPQASPRPRPASGYSPSSFINHHIVWSLSPILLKQIMSSRHDMLSYFPNLLNIYKNLKLNAIHSRAKPFMPDLLWAP